MTGEETTIPVALDLLFVITDIKRGFFFSVPFLYNIHVLLYLGIADTRILSKIRFCNVQLCSCFRDLTE